MIKYLIQLVLLNHLRTYYLNFPPLAKKKIEITSKSVQLALNNDQRLDESLPDINHAYLADVKSVIIRGNDRK